MTVTSVSPEQVDQIAELKAENGRLKSENENLTLAVVSLRAFRGLPANVVQRIAAIEKAMREA